MFVTDELVWAVRRERSEEMRQIRPHTDRKPDGERSAHEHEGHVACETWAGPALRRAAHGSS
jgi:hypothetical protein